MVHVSHRFDIDLVLEERAESSTVSSDVARSSLNDSPEVSHSTRRVKFEAARSG